MTDSRHAHYSEDFIATHKNKAQALKGVALSTVQMLARDTWTDHNASDPGITILEVLTFVICDLCERLALPVEELLLPNPSMSGQPRPYYTAPQILPSNPVTLNDHRRSIMDVEGVKNADITRRMIEVEGDSKTIPTGQFDIKIDVDDGLAATADINETNILLERVRRQFLSRRNVNEDLAAITVLKKDAVVIKVKLSITSSVDPMQLVSKLFTRISDAIAPSVRKYQYDELVSQGLSGDKIFDGPLLSQGFVKQSDLGLLKLPDTLYSSDIMVDLNSIEGLDAIISFCFSSPDSEADKDSLFWRRSIKAGHIPSLDLEQSYQALSIDIEGQAYSLPDLSEGELRTLIQPKTTIFGNGLVSESHHAVESRYKQLGAYTSLQHHMPKLFGLTEQRLNGPVTDKAVAEILQLKGYLTIFDQILSDQFAQLESLKTLLALPNKEPFERLARVFSKMMSSETLTQVDITQFWNDVKTLPLTRLSQPVQGISGLAPLLGEYFKQYNKNGFQHYAEASFSPVQLDRLQRSLQHLLARFSESTLDVNLLKYKAVFAGYAPLFAADNYVLPPFDTSNSQPDAFLLKLVHLKQIIDLVYLLNQYPTLSRLRTGGFDYLSDSPRRDFVSGLSERIMRFMGINNVHQLPLATNNREGMYLLESELLRFGSDPLNNFKEGEYTPNTLYFIAPEWPSRFANTEFRALLEKQIVNSIPVYQQANILYLPRNSMSLFERLYFAWLNAMSKLPINSDSVKTAVATDNIQQQAEREKLALVELLSTLLRQFFAQPDNLRLIILQEFLVDDFYQKLLPWMKNAEERSQLEGDSVTDIQDNLRALLSSRAISQEEAEDLYEKILFFTSQEKLDILATASPIGMGTIAGDFRVSYRKLNYLKPSYPLGNVAINPQAQDEPSLALAISKPHTII